MHIVNWSDLKSSDFAQSKWQQAIAILPLGATEQHGPHLPLGVDSFIVQGLIKAAVQKNKSDGLALLLPVLPIGFSPEHQSYGGTLSLSAKTVMALWSEIATSVAETGVRKLLFFNAHGGHTGLMDAVGRELRQNFGMLVYSCNWENLIDRGLLETLFGAHELRFGAHAGAVETSVMLALHPELVDMQKAENFTSTSEQRAKNHKLLGNGRSAKQSWAIEDYNPLGAVGNAQNASAEKGAQLIEAASQGLVQLLAEISLQDLPLAQA